MRKKLLTFILACLSGFTAVAQKPDTLTTASGIKYFFLNKGNGPALTANRLAIWHYQLNLEDGTKIDASRDRGTPFAAPYPSTKVIKGVTEALSMMRVGDRGIFIIPSGLAYGDAGREVIPPKATLIFDMELVDIKEKSLQMILDSVLFEKPVTNRSKPRMKEVLETYQQLKARQFKDVYVSEDDLNTIGYELIKDFPKQAVEIFKLNVELYPQNWNVYDSLAEAYMALGMNGLALKNYQVSVKLNPGNTNGVEMIEKLKGSKL